MYIYELSNTANITQIHTHIYTRQMFPVDLLLHVRILNATLMLMFIRLILVATAAINENKIN